MAPKAAAKADPKTKAKAKADKVKQAKAKAIPKAAAKAAAADPAAAQLAVDLKKEQQNFVNSLKYRAKSCGSIEAQQLLQAHWAAKSIPPGMISCRLLVVM